MKMLVACVVLSACGLALADDKKNPRWSNFDHLQGTWVVIDTRGFSKGTPEDQIKGSKLIIRDHDLTVRYAATRVKATFSLKETTTPQQMDVKIADGPEEAKGKTFPCIYLLEEPVLKIAFRDPGEKRPSEFATEDPTDLHEVRFKKAPQ